jgi:tetratricopeptide (TPR) repeat protein
MEDTPKDKNADSEAPPADPANPGEELDKLMQTAISIDEDPPSPVFDPEEAKKNREKALGETFAIIEFLNEEGNNQFRSKNYRAAIEKYKQALKTAHADMFNEIPELKRKYRDLRIRVINNLAFCCLKLGDYGNAAAATELGL